MIFQILMTSMIAMAQVTPNAVVGNTLLNLLPNGGMEPDAGNNARISRDWTASGGTRGEATSGANFMYGRGTMTWDSNAATQTLTHAAVTVPNGLVGANGGLTCDVFVASGTPSHRFQILNGSNVLNEVNVTRSGTYDLSFVYPSSGTLQPRFLAVAANEPLISIDNCRLGYNLNIGSVSQASYVGRASFAGTAGCDWTRTNTVVGAFGTVAACPAITVQDNPGPGTISTVDADLPQVTLNNAPPGVYFITAKLRMDVSGSINAALALSDGTTTMIPIGGNPVSTAESITLTGSFTYTSSGNRTWAIHVGSSAGTVFLNNSGSYSSTSFEIYRYPLASEIAVRPNVANWRVDANISGADPSLGSAAVTSYTGITNASLSLTNNSSGTLTAQIPCSATNAPTGTTCAVGDESIGVAFDLPRAGSVLACASFTHNSNANGAGNTARTAFQIVETAPNAQTIIQEGKSRVVSGHADTDTQVLYPHRLCGTFNFTSTGQKVLRLMYEQSVSGTGPSTNVISASADPALGQNDIHWEIYPTDQAMPAPLLVGSVTSGSAGALRIETAILTSTVSACTVTSSSSAWIGTPTRNGTGDCTWPYVGFSGQATCFPSPYAAITTGRAVTLNAPNTTSFRSFRFIPAGAAEDGDLMVICIGPR